MDTVSNGETKIININNKKISVTFNLHYLKAKEKENNQENS